MRAIVGSASIAPFGLPGHLRGLHTDESLAEQLRASHAVTSCGDVYRRTYHERFVEDLEFIRAVYARAALLDWTLDPLADYIVASDAPEHADAVRSEKERVHRAAHAAYVHEYFRAGIHAVSRRASS